ncbi:response regulator [Hydrogenophaga sp. 5NK40-0174]|uniref:response regulator n=1 Tax=Hydrogenophaga sp. 5NK40-0174 TaxID=3127649 RepID=UPI0033410EDE
MKVLLAEDDQLLGSGVERALQQAGMRIDWVRNGESAETALSTHTYDLLLLDLGLPRQNGLKLLQRMRQAENPLPVLVVSARDAIKDRVGALNLGADDYLTKPFDLDELIARMHALVRRRGGRATPDLKAGSLTMQPQSRDVTLDGEPLQLSQKEFDLLHILMETPGTVRSREEMEERMYSWEKDIGSNAVEVHLHNLRRKLGGNWIRNVRGVGYKLVPPDSA